jgi:coproporphyrinogen III oxidase-like Fe-S oxidoreductase
MRWKNSLKLSSYLETEWTEVGDAERLDTDGKVGEQLMLGLRLIDGVSLRKLEDWCSQEGVERERRERAIARHSASGLLEVSDERLRLTRRGLLLADHVLQDLI